MPALGVRSARAQVRTGGKHMGSLYEHAGREEALHRLEEVFYGKVLPIRCCGACFRNAKRIMSNT